MKPITQSLILSSGAFLLLNIPAAHAQSILSQSSDDLLKDFDVDPNQVATQYQQKPLGKAERLLQMLQGLMSKVNAPDTVSGDGSTLRLRAPFVKFDMANGQRCVRVNAPFVSYDSNPRMSADLRNLESAAASQQHVAPAASSSINTAFPDIPNSTVGTPNSPESVTSEPVIPTDHNTTGGAGETTKHCDSKGK